jgi:hypothetical protein
VVTKEPTLLEELLPPVFALLCCLLLRLVPREIVNLVSGFCSVAVFWSIGGSVTRRLLAKEKSERDMNQGPPS